MNRFHTLLLVIYLAAGGFLESLAQEVEGQKPKLNNHTFVPVSFMNSGFNNTSFTLPIGIGSTSNFNFSPALPELDSIDGLNGEILFASLGFKYSQKVQDWISFNLELGLTARLGTNVESILSQGFNTVINFEVGSMVKIYQSNKTRLSLSVVVQNYNANFVDIAGFVKDVINEESDPKILRQIPALTTGGGLHFAWGINDLFGVRAESTYIYGETFTRGKSNGFYSIKGGVDINFNERYQVPLGLAITYTITTEPKIVYVDNRSGRMFFGKLAYTGRKDFDIGIEAGAMVLPFQNIEEKPTILMANLTMSYFFN
ncbi:MAG: hypothetical protein DHS20C17_11320 [Cyclobacteriaceae bacterium]|nr:MAG: hypothetical protein DHS20C17_11320 [Cyclobacteriaceae bacterium]